MFNVHPLPIISRQHNISSGMCSAEGEKKKENYFNIQCAKANRTIITICTLLNDKQYIAVTYANPIILWIWKGFNSNGTVKRSKFQI